MRRHEVMLIMIMIPITFGLCIGLTNNLNSTNKTLERIEKQNQETIQFNKQLLEAMKEYKLELGEVGP